MIRTKHTSDKVRNIKKQYIKEGQKMIYRDFQGMKLSALGFGAMRLPVLDGDNSKVDEAAVAEMVAYAMEQGRKYSGYLEHADG